MNRSFFAAIEWLVSIEAHETLAYLAEVAQGILGGLPGPGDESLDDVRGEVANLSRRLPDAPPPGQGVAAGNRGGRKRR